MKIALIGATGFIGQHILNEALSRKHQVTALVRNINNITPVSGLSSKALDIHNSAQLSAVLAGYDAVILAIHYEGVDRHTLVNTVKNSGIPRALFVGGAASLEVAPGVRLLDSPDFPAEWKDTATAAADLLTILRGEKTLNWTYLSPSAFIEPGQRTSKFRLGKEQLLVDEKGESRISNQDFAVAMINEVEQPAHAQQRFTVGY